MTQITQAKLKELNVLQLYEHYGALERSLPLLTPESQELAKAELEACAHLRSEKIDRIYYAMAAHEDAIDRIKKESDLITKARRHHESQLKSLKGLLNWLKRSLPFDTNKISGRDYQFTLVKKKTLTVEISTDPTVWNDQEKTDYCIEEEVSTTKRTVLRSLSGEVLSDRTEPKTTTKIVPNLDAIRNAHQEGKLLPDGVKVIQEYSIRSKRIYGKQSMDLEASEYPRELLPED
jgi:hypothetical protein|tara:strand:+ start:1374 stop:2075 length:702 start_codon:yes stop_codon:yes gene_type:complete